jgi:hypothetical protein
MMSNGQFTRISDNLIASEIDESEMTTVGDQDVISMKIIDDDISEEQMFDCA